MTTESNEKDQNRTQFRGSVWMTADRLVVGNHIVPPGKSRPVEIIGQLSDPGSADYFEFACMSRQGRSAVRLHRSEKVEVLHPKRTEERAHGERE